VCEVSSYLRFIVKRIDAAVELIDIKTKLIKTFASLLIVIVQIVHSQ
jgi:hypothetical protein